MGNSRSQTEQAQVRPAVHHRIPADHGTRIRSGKRDPGICRWLWPSESDFDRKTPLDDSRLPLDQGSQPPVQNSW